MTTPVWGATAQAHSDDFAGCYRAHYGRLERALRLAGADAATAEDLAQEAFARTFLHWPRVRRGANPPGYAYRVGFRLLARRWRRQEPLGLDAASISDAVPGPEDEAITRVALLAALAALPPRRRLVAVMCLVVDVSPAETADILGIAQGTVRKHMEQARAALRLATRDR